MLHFLVNLVMIVHDHEWTHQKMLLTKKATFSVQFSATFERFKKMVTSLKTPGCPSLILADNISAVLLYATVQSQVDNSCTFLCESGCWGDVLYPQAKHPPFVLSLLYIRFSLKLSEGFTTLH